METTLTLNEYRQYRAATLARLDQLNAEILHAIVNQDNAPRLSAARVVRDRVEAELIVTDAKHYPLYSAFQL